jgi:spore coat protein SA
MPEFIEHDVNGLLVKPHNPKELGNSIERLLEDSQLRKCLGKNARTKINRHWTWEKRAKELVKVYEECVKDQAI